MGEVLPEAPSVEGASLWVVRGAEMKSQEGFSVRGGSLSKSFVSGLVAFLIEHPYGRLLIDAGVGRNVYADLGKSARVMQALASIELEQATIDALATRDIQASDLRGIILTHSPWDHVCGREDLRDGPVWMTPEALDHARSDDAGGKLYRQLEAQDPFQLHDLTFPDGAYGPF